MKNICVCVVTVVFLIRLRDEDELFPLSDEHCKNIVIIRQVKDSDWFWSFVPNYGLFRDSSGKDDYSATYRWSGMLLDHSPTLPG